MSVVLVGLGNALIASMYFGKGRILSSVILKPAKSTSLLQNWNFFGFNTIPALPHAAQKFQTVEKMDRGLL